MYESLEQFLAQLPASDAQIWLTLTEIEAIAGKPLPPSARRAGFWSKGHECAEATWLRQGFAAHLDRKAAAVCFTRRTFPGAEDAVAGREPHTESAGLDDAAAAMEGGKYAPLIQLLRDTPIEQELVQLTTAEIEAILGEPLPMSALRSGFWSSHGLNASRAWKRLGFVVRLDRSSQCVLFIRKAA